MKQSEYRGATIIPITTAEPRKIIMQLRSPDAPTNPDRVGLPGGRSNPGEDLIQTAIREFGEETTLWLPRERFWLMGYPFKRRGKVGVYQVDIDPDEFSRMKCMEGTEFVLSTISEIVNLPLSSYVAEEILPKFGRKIARIST